MTNLTEATVIVNEATQSLAQSNAEADRAEYHRLATALTHALTNPRIGVWNVIALLPDILRSLANGGGKTRRDYLFAAEILGCVTPALDLNYGENSTWKARVDALCKLYTALSGVKP